MLLTDLSELKAVLQIDPRNTAEDKILNFYVEQATAIIEEALNRDFSFKTRTQYYDGTGTQKLLLRNRPVYPAAAAPFTAIKVVYDSQGLYGQAPNAFASSTTTPLTYGVDYTLKIDQDDGGSRSGILYKVNDLWTKPQVRQRGLLSPFIGPDTGSYQIIYTAGYTADTLPAAFRWATNLLVARMRYLMPVGLVVGSESYEERAISFIVPKRDYLTGLVKEVLQTYRNWRW